MSRSILTHWSFNFYRSCQADYRHTQYPSSARLFMAWISPASRPKFSYGNGKIRLCLNPQPLNKGLKQCHFPISMIEDILPDLTNAKVFMMVDCKNGYSSQQGVIGWGSKISQHQVWGLLRLCRERIKVKKSENFPQHRWCTLVICSLLKEFRQIPSKLKQ